MDAFNATHTAVRSMTQYTPNERLLVVSIKTATALLTTVSSFAFLVYILVESIRKKIFRNMAIRFLTYLQFSSMMSAIGGLYSIQTSTSTSDDLLCHVQAIQTQFFDWVQFLWTLCIGSFLLITVVLAIPPRKTYVLFPYLTQ